MLDPSGNDVIANIDLNYRNLNKAVFEGVDFEMGYSRSVNLFGGGERMGVRLLGSYLVEASTTNSAGLKTENTGSLPAQNFERKVNLSFNYSRGPFRWNLSGRYNSGGYLVSTWNQPDTNGNIVWNAADNHKGGSVYWDTRLTYGIPVGSGQIEVFGNIQNLFNRDPPLVLTAANAIGQVSGGYDQLGRRYVMGVNLRF